MAEAGYLYRVWCPDCTGQDFQGCFQGGTEVSEHAYPDEGAAVAAARKRIGDTIYRFRIEREGDEAPDWLIPYGEEG
jgi:hypothetical protein